MSEESDHPNGSGVVQSTPMEALNDELTSKTDKPDQELKEGSNIRHDISGFEKFLTTSVQTIRFYWPPILFSSIVFTLYFFFKNDIIEIIITWPELAPLFITSTFLLMFKLSKKEDAVKKESMALKMKVMSKSEEIEKLKRILDHVTTRSEELNAKLDEIESLKRESAEKSLLMREVDNEIKSKAEEIEKNDSDAKMAGMDNEIKLKDEENNILKPTEFTLRAKFTDLSELEVGKHIFSTQTVIDGITWTMGVCKNIHSISIDLYAEKKDSVEWFCPVIAELRLISQKSKEFVRRGERKLCFDEERNHNLLQYSGFNDEDEFVVDDSITIAIAIKAFPICINEATKFPLRFQFSDISELCEDVEVYSEPTEIDGITWMMRVEDWGNSIRVCLNAEKKDAIEWLSAVIVDLQLVSQTSGEMVHITRAKMMYDGDDIDDIGYISKEEYLFDEEKGFMKNDSIIVIMDIKAFPIN